jgi:hypothetical protein
LKLGRRPNLLLLTEEEASRLAVAARTLHVPSNFIILEAVQFGLQALDPTKITKRRRKIVYFRLPTEIKQRVIELAQELDLSQQSLIRHYLSTYLTQLGTKTPKLMELRTTPTGDPSGLNL